MIRILVLCSCLAGVSCGTLGSGSRDEMVADLIDLGSAAAALKYPKYAAEAGLLAAWLRGNSEMSERKLRVVLDKYLAASVPDPELRLLLARVVMRVAERSRGRAERGENLRALAGELESEFGTTTGK